MGDMYDEFQEAAKEIDELSLSGYFGKDTQTLTEKRDSIPLMDHFVEVLDDWNNDINQYGKDEVKKLMILFFKMYTEAIGAGGQQAIDVLTAFFKGFPDNPETECLSSYTESMRAMVEYKEHLKEIQGKSTTTEEIKRFADSLINAYLKGVEFVGKMLTMCILLLQISKKQEIDHMEVYFWTLGKKSNKFKKLSKRKYDKILNMIDRKIRNAGSHLDLRYSPKEEKFIYKVRINRQVRVKKISANMFMKTKFPKTGWVIQAFIYSSMLMAMSGMAPEKYQMMTKKIFQTPSK